MKKVIMALGLSVMMAGSVFANYDTGVIDYLEETQDWDSYLQQYNYSTWLSDHRYLTHDIYASPDKLVLISFFNGRLDSIFILGPGYKTNKGAEVGMHLSDILEIYGRDCEVINGFGNYRGYGYVEYVDQQNSGLSFVFDRRTQEVLLIRYQRNRHGNSNVMADVQDYTLLPFNRA